MATQERIRHNLLAAIRRVLRPLVRIAIENGVMHTDFSTEVRAAYLDVARANELAKGRQSSETRLRLLTGLSTAEMAQLREVNSAKASRAREENGASTLAASVLSAWHTEPRYTFAFGLPVELPVDAPEGRPSIGHLVRKFDPSADVSLVIEQLVDVGCIREVGSGRFVVVSRVFTTLSEGNIRYFAEACERFIRTAEHNLKADKDSKLMERAVYADNGIPDHRLPEFMEFVKSQWSKFADPLDDYMNSPRGPGQEAGRVVQTGVGVYHYVSYESQETQTQSKNEGREGT